METTMVGDSQNVTHSAEAAALGFYYQTFFALLTLLERDTDNAAIGVEQLDDVVLKTNGETLLFQLKHSITAQPPPITLKSRALWRTMKAWIDVLSALTLSETTLAEVLDHLRAIGVAVLGGPVQRTGALGPITSVYFRDLDGNLVEVANYEGT